MDKVMWKVSGLLFLTSTLVGLMGGLLAAPQSGAQTRKKIHNVHKETKDQVTQAVHDLKRSVANAAQQGNAYRKNWLTPKGLSEWEQGFLEFPSIAPAKITRWPPKEAH
jgi:gas vesicle protein